MELLGTFVTTLCWIGGGCVAFWIIVMPILNWLKQEITTIISEDVIKGNRMPGPNDGIRSVSSCKGRLGKMRHFRIQPIFDGEGKFAHFRVEIMCEGWDQPCQFVTDGKGLEDIEETVKKVRGIKLAADAMGELD